MNDLLSENEIRRFLKLSNVNSDKSLEIDKKLLEETVNSTLDKFILSEEEPPSWAAGKAGDAFRKELAAGFPDEKVGFGSVMGSEVPEYEPDEPDILPAPTPTPDPVPTPPPGPVSAKPPQPKPVVNSPVDRYVEPTDLNKEMDTTTKIEKDLIDSGLTSFAGNEKINVRNVEKAYGTQGMHSYLNSINAVKSLKDDILYIGDVSNEGGGKMRGHKSHRDGHDVDIAYFTTGGPAIKHTPDGKRTWEFTKVGSFDDLDTKNFDFIRHTAPKAKFIFMDKEFVKKYENMAKDMSKSGDMSTDEYKAIKKALHAEPNHRDHMHVRLKKTPSVITKQHVAKAAVPAKQTDYKTPKNWQHGVVFGEIGGTIPLEEYNSAQVFYGASSPKPILALMNLIYSKDPNSGIQRMSDEELKGLLNYTGMDSNRVNRALSGRGPTGRDKVRKKYNDYVSKRSKEIGIKTEDQTAEFLKNMELDQLLPAIRYGKSHNKQTAAGYYNFMKTLLDHENHPYLSQHKEEAKTILSYMKREAHGDKDREAKRWRDLKDYLNTNLPSNADGSPAIKSIWGKGGKAFGALNYGVVVNDKYVLSAYSQHPDKSGENNKAYRESQNTLNKIVLDTLNKHMFKQTTGGKKVKPVIKPKITDAAKNVKQRPKVYVIGDSHAAAGSMRRTMQKHWGDLGYDVVFKAQNGKGWQSLNTWVREVEEAGDASRVIVAAMGGNVAKNNRWNRQRRHLESAANTLKRLQDSGAHIDYFGLPYSAQSEEFANRRRSVESVQKDVLAKYGINYISMLDETRPETPLDRSTVGSNIGVRLKDDLTHYKNYTNYANHINSVVLNRNPIAKFAAVQPVPRADFYPAAPRTWSMDITGPVLDIKPEIANRFSEAFENPNSPRLKKWATNTIKKYEAIRPDVGKELRRRWNASLAKVKEMERSIARYR